jgi:BirA family transcriptional regulator, biotin operon repressor / biotin---[acetyl-CoA-carboxylase] ligase
VPSRAPSLPRLNIALLDRLRAAGGDYVPLGELCGDLERVRADLEALVNFGFGVEQHPYRGAAFSAPAQRLCPDQIEHALATSRIGGRIAVWNRVTSTNDLAVRAGTSASNDGLVVLAEEQTAGRGRRGRSWSAPPCSSILMSILLFPPPRLAPPTPDAAFGCAWLTVLGAVAVAEVVTAWIGREATIKWPNDVRLEGRKIAGILVERLPAPQRPAFNDSASPAADSEWGAVIGIGLNVNLDHDAFPPELAALATSMQIEGGGALIDRSELARDLIKRLDHWYDASRSQGIEILNSPWQARSEHMGRSVRIATAGRTVSGCLVDIDLRLGLTVAAAGQADRASLGENPDNLIRVALAEILTLEDESNDRARHDPARG